MAGALLAALAFIVLFTPALIEINGEKEVEVAYGESYEDEGAAVRFGLGSVKTENNVAIKLSYTDSLQKKQCAR